MIHGLFFAEQTDKREYPGCQQKCAPVTILAVVPCLWLVERIAKNARK
jgi:hypothetical protein